MGDPDVRPWRVGARDYLMDSRPLDAAERAQAMAFECSHAVPEPGTTHWDKQQSCLQKHLRQAEQAARQIERRKVLEELKMRLENIKHCPAENWSELQKEDWSGGVEFAMMGVYGTIRALAEEVT